MAAVKISRYLLAIPLMLALLAGPVHAAEKRYQRSMENYTMPDVSLVNQNGSKVRFKSLIESGKPVIVDFIYGTCTTICPILSASFANLQRKLGANSQSVHLISITIDPENDTPKVMKEYLKNYRAQPGWDFLTGSRADIDRVMKAFDAYFPTKMSHRQLNFIKTRTGTTWIKLDGLMSTSDFMNEFQKAETL